MEVGQLRFKFSLLLSQPYLPSVLPTSQRCRCFLFKHFFFVFFVLGSTRGRKANMVWGKPPASTGMTLLLRHDVQQVKQGHGTWLTRLVHVRKICESKTLKQEHENKIWNPTVFFFFYVPTTCAGQIWTTAPPPNVANTTNYYTELLPHWTLPAPHVHNSDSFLRESENVFAWTLTDPTRLLPEKQPMGADITSPPPPCCSFCKFHQGPDGTVTCTVQSGEKFIKCLDWTGGRRWWSHIWCLHNEAQSRYSTARYQNLLVPLKPSLNSGSKVSVKLCCRGLITHYLVFRCTHRSIRQPSSYKMTCCICPTLNHSQLRPNQDCI